MSGSIGSERRVLTPAALRGWPLPVPDNEKTLGRVLIVGGSRGTPGAVLLAGVAALRVGAGVLQLAGPASVATALGIHVPEAQAFGLPETATGAVARDAADGLADLLAGARAVLIGPGLFGVEGSQSLVTRLVERVGPATMLVLDAYALRGLRPASVAAVAGRLVLTPNTGEAAALLDVAEEAMGDLGEAAGEIASRFGTTVALHGHVAAAERGGWVDESANNRVGMSGSGDVLAGLVTGLLARGATTAQAACWGTHVHASAGDRLSARIGRLGFLAREILDEVPPILTDLGARLSPRSSAGAVDRYRAAGPPAWDAIGRVRGGWWWRAVAL
ncbi:MAG: NAD(P)H-hydrate dehydratase [Pseudonocardiales bacterium]|nr:MAG: NAD(P)H-hydrate dehydratase [Pseudonocardiales bacterium]